MMNQISPNMQASTSETLTRLTSITAIGKNVSNHLLYKRRKAYHHGVHAHEHCDRPRMGRGIGSRPTNTVMPCTMHVYSFITPTGEI